VLNRRTASSLVVAVLLASFVPAASATVYYVSGAGSDAASGLSKHMAFRTLQHASDLTKPGDIVYAMTGTYRNSVPAGPVLKISHPGTPAQWIVYAAYPGQKPLISFNGWAGVAFDTTAAYVELRGFAIRGNNYNVTLEGAKSHQLVADPEYDGNCVIADGRGGTATQRPHHLSVIHNEVYACGGGGLAFIETDYVTVSDNTIYDSSWYSIYGNSPIAINSSWNSDGFTGYKFFIVRNRIYGNRELIPWKAVGYISDGEGIIIDTNRDKAFQNYNGRTLIANNVIYHNDSSAIQVFLSDHVDIMNNSTFENVESKDPKFVDRGEINVTDAVDVNVIDNVIYSHAERNPLTIGSKHPCTACYVDYNVYFNGLNNPKGLGGPHDIVADPLYLNATASDRTRVDLRLGAGSPAIKSGTPWLDRYVDADGGNRGWTEGWDRGAYASGPTASSLAKRP
jgi:hypothetical protein